MATPLEYITQNNLDWQSTFKGETSVSGRSGYRGSLVITEGKVLSADKQLPPKATLKQAIMTADGSAIEFVAGELETIDFFLPFVAKYKEFLTPAGSNILYIVDLDKDVKVIHEGVPFYAFVLDESSVWNELLELADLPKSELKRMDAAEKIDAVADALKDAQIKLPEVTLEAFLALKSGVVRERVGAV